VRAGLGGAGLGKEPGRGQAGGGLIGARRPGRAGLGGAGLGKEPGRGRAGGGLIGRG